MGTLSSESLPVPLFLLLSLSLSSLLLTLLLGLLPLSFLALSALFLALILEEDLKEVLPEPQLLRDEGLSPSPASSSSKLLTL